MPRNRIGELRRSQVVTTFGPGSVVDFRSDGAPVSVVIAGMEEWDRRAQPAGLRNEQTIFEPRLQRKLGVAGFRLPPVAPDDNEQTGPVLVGVRFPVSLQCPSCHQVKPAGKWNRMPGEPARWCGECSARSPGGRPIHVIPVRFICACENGHLDEFPWGFWVRHKKGCAQDRPLVLRSEGAGLGGLFLRCPSCAASRSMEGVFGVKALEGLMCRGERTWLASNREDCGLTPRALQRGASNLYFPVSHSALDIPPFSDSLQKQLGQYWDPICNVAPEHRAGFISSLATVLGPIGMTPEQLATRVEERLGILNASESGNLRWDEYHHLDSGQDSPSEKDDEFEIRQSPVTPAIRPFVGRLVRAVRLREVRAISAFTRIRPPAGGGEDGARQVAQIQVTRHNWLPAIEVRGEGIFLALNRDRLQSWEALPLVRERAARIQEKLVSEWRERMGTDEGPEREITARFLLVHTLAHVLMRELSLECGYSTASLRERLYVGNADEEMCGLLIYTATSDADGTLGGLVRQGQPDRMATLLKSAIRSVQWCSSDPLCISGLTSVSEPMNLAACHSCVLAPETSCEEFNRFLDRALLVGLPEHTEIGYFSELIAEESPGEPDRTG